MPHSPAHGGRAHDAIEAIWVALEQGDPTAALKVATEHAELFIEWGFDAPLERLEGLLDRLEAHAADDPWLLYYRAWAWSTQRRHTLALVTLKRAERRFDATLALDSAEWRRARFLLRVAEGTVAEREGLYEAAREAFEEALQLSGAEIKPARSEQERRWIEHDPSGFFSFTLQALAVYRRMGLVLPMARAAHNLGTRLTDRGEPAAALHFLEQAHELKAPGGTRVSLANTLNSLGQAERHLGLRERAGMHLAEALAIAREQGHAWLESYALNNLAELQRDLGDFPQAQALYRQSVEIKEQTDNAFGLAFSYASLADLLLLTNDLSAARDAADRAVTLRVPSDDALETARLLACQARIRIAAHADLSEAAANLATVIGDLRRLDAKAELMLAVWWLGAARRLLGDEPGTRDAVAEAFDLAHRFRLGHLLAPHLPVPPQLAEEARQASAVIPVRVPSAPGKHPAVNGSADAPRLSARLFGELRIELDGTEVPTWSWRSKRAVSLLALLLQRRGQPLHRDEAIEWLWPAADPERAGKHLNVALSALRRGLDEVAPAGASCIQRMGATYRIHPNTLSMLDVAEFERHATDADHRAQRGELASAVKAADVALALVTGDYLASEPYAEWAEPERERLHDRALELRTGVAEWHLTLGEARDAIREASSVLAAERWRERAWQVLVEAHQALGDRSAALQALAACQAALHEELDIQPSPPLIALAAQLRA
ncbi:MAG: tetratricopeptide repeat protein [Chloroflexota bacterium]